MSEQSSAPSESSAGSESTPDSQVSGSTSNSSSESSGQSSGSPLGSIKGAEASQVAEALSDAEKIGSDLYEVVVDGETLQLTKAELMAGYQKAKSSAKKFQEAAQLRKEAEEHKAETSAKREAMRKNPLKFLMEDGVDEASARKHYEEAVWAWLQQDQMTPEQKQAIADQRKHETEKQQLAREKAEIEAWKKERQAEKERAEVEKYQNDFASQLTTAITKHNLPNSPSVVSKLIEYMKDGLSYDDTYTFEDAVQIYKDEHQSSFMDQLKKMSPDQLMAAIGPEGVKAFRKIDVEQNVKNPAAPSKKPTTSEPKSKDNRISAKELFARR